MAGGALRRAMIDAIRGLQAKTENVYDRCEAAPLERPDCVAVGPKGGCLITPLHVVSASHYPVGPVIRWDWGERRVVARTKITGTDLEVATLDRPATVQPACSLPWDWHLDLRTDRWGSRLRRPLRGLGSKPQGSVVECEVHRLGAAWGARGPFASGDSGQAVWLPLERPILVGCHLYAGHGPGVAHYWEELLKITGRDGYVMDEGVF